MKSNKTVLLLLILMLVTACGGGGGGGGGSSSGITPPAAPPAVTGPSGPNVFAVTVNGALCSNNSTINKACVSVTICEPGTSTCQTINDILLDTASYGLRIFNQALTISLPQVSIPAGPLAECVQFGDGSSVWGPVQTASVILGGEPAVQVPVQIVDSTFGTRPAPCQNAEVSPSTAGFNGILGLGFFAEDCGSICEVLSRNGMYYVCAGTGCTGTTVPLSNQVQNPASSLAQDNNGVIVQLPSVPSDGTPSVNGFVLLGIGTQSNNVPSGVTSYPASQSGDFITIFNGASFSGFLDTGSNGLFFPASGVLPNCAAPNAVWFCPPSLTTLSATNQGAFGTPTNAVQFQIGNFVSLIASSNRVFPDTGGNGPGLFVWGLPFYLGRNVYLGFEGRGSSLGNGPYWAY
jgi:hypothetical protein